MTTEIHEGPLEASRPPLDVPAKLTWREKRYRRRRRRVWFEEVLGWILVPVILIGCYWMLNIFLTAIGTSPTAVIEGIESIISAL
jgi:hypothetical protein